MSVREINSAEELWHAWQDERIAFLTSAQGNLALIETNWLSEDENVSADEILKKYPNTVTFTNLERRGVNGELIQHGYRLWDSASEGIQKFSGVDHFEYNPSAVVYGEFVQYGEVQAVPYEYLRDNGGTRDLAVPGEILVKIENQEYRLHAFKDDQELLLVFGDATNKLDDSRKTYGSGRFLFVKFDENSGNKVVLDFNRAFVPPCGFSNQFNCPMPPLNNKIATAIFAGEKNPIFK